MAKIDIEKPEKSAEVEAATAAEAKATRAVEAAEALEDTSAVSEAEAALDSAAEDASAKEAPEDEVLEEEAPEEEPESNDSLTFSNGVIEKIVATAVRDVPGVLGMKGGFVNRIQETFGASVATKGVTVEIAPDNTMSVNIAIVMEYGAYAPQVFEDVKKVVVEQVAGMTGLEVGGVNLRIEDVLTAEEFNRLQAPEDEAE